MLRCNECRPLILDHLFGLLEAAEIAAVTSHLAQCPACAAEQAQAAKVHGLIAQAAKMGFPAVRFDAPGAKPVAAKANAPARNPMLAPLPAGQTKNPTQPAAPKEQRRRKGMATTPSLAARIIPWAVAAAVLIAVPGTVFPVVNLLTRAELARKDADESTVQAAEALKTFENTGRELDQRRFAAHNQFVAAKQAHDNVLAAWVAAEKNAALTQDDRKLTWEVMKPAAVQPGAPNEFLLVIRDKRNTPSGQLVAEFRDQTDAVIHAQSINHEQKNEHPIRLPAGVWTKLKHDSELFLVVSRVDEKTQEKTILQDKVPLLGPVFTTVLATDKPKYWPGETVRFRSLTLDRVRFAPPTREQILQYELRGPNGSVVRAGAIRGGTDLVRVVEGDVVPVLGPDKKPIRGVGTGEFALPLDAPEGEYTIVMRELPHPSGTPPVVPFPVTRTIRIEPGVPETFHKEIRFVAASYAAGDLVQAVATLKFRDAPVAGAKIVSVVAVIDDQSYELATNPSLLTDAHGDAPFSFRLPNAIQQGDARLKVTFLAKNEAGKEVEESTAKRMPVVGPNLIVEFFPEGGDLVAGVACRVYVRATTPSGLPVDIAGEITDGRKILAQVKTLTDNKEQGANRGLAVFDYMPELGQPAWLKLSAPSHAFSPILVDGKLAVVPAAVAGAPVLTATRRGFLLPEPSNEGVVMRVINPVSDPSEPIKVRLWSIGRERKLVVGAYTRGRLTDTKVVTVKPDKPEEPQLLPPDDRRGGVVRVTVFEDPEVQPGEPKPDLLPVAERLVFRRPGQALNLNFSTSGTKTAIGADGKPAFEAGSQIELNLSATDENKKPVAAILYAAVVNSAVAAGAKDRTLPTHFLVAGEVNTPDAMEYADFLLTDHPRAAESLDMVLATQGWRRFAEQIPANYARNPVAPTQERANLLVCNGQYMTSVEPVSVQDHQKLRNQYWPRYETAVRKLDEAKADAEAADADRNASEGIQKLAIAANEARKAAKAKVEQAGQAGVPVERFLGAGWFAVGGFGVLAVILAVAAFTRNTGRLPLGIGSLGSVGLVAFLIVALGTAERTHAAGTNDEAVKLQTARLPERVIPIAPLPSEPRSARAGRDAERESLAERDADKAPTKEGGKAAADPAGGAVAGGYGPGGGLAAAPMAAAQAPGVANFNNRFDGRPGMNYSPFRGAVPAPNGPTKPAAGSDRIGLPGGAGGNGLPPAAPGAMPAPGDVRNGRWLGDGGWQPGKFKKPIPDDLLPSFDNDQILLESPKKREELREAAAKASNAARRLSPIAKGDTKGNDKQEKADEQYRKDLEKAKEYTQRKYQELQRRLESGLRQRDEAEQFGQATGELKSAPQNSPQTPDANALGGAGQNMLGKQQKDVQVPAETRAIYRVRASVPTSHPLVVREYAAPRPGSEGGQVSEFEADTILWQPVIVLPADGKTTLPVQLGSAPGGYQVLIAGHTLNGRIGAVRGMIPVAPAAPAANVDPNAP